MLTLKTIIIIIIASVVAIVYLLLPKQQETSTRMFCAYERVFVEFQERNNTWGVLFLDDNGNPVYCNEIPGKEKITIHPISL